MPAADEVARLQSGSDPECRMFQTIAEQGHYAGRTVPTRTRQGTYAFTPSGQFLASINNNRPEAMAKMLEQALAKWAALTPDQRLGTADPAAQTAQVVRPERFFPKDGMVWRVFSRDLPRGGQTAADWRGEAWNLDTAWFRKEEVGAFVPPRLEPGAVQEVDAPALRRFVRLNVVDNVRGQTPAYAPEDVKTATMRLEVVRVANGKATLAITGRMHAEATGTWAIQGFRDMNSPTAQTRGIAGDVVGEAVWNTRSQRFEKFDFVLSGLRWGATQYNGRHDDPGPHPIGFAVRLGDGTGPDRVAPANWWAYGWR